MSEYSSARKVLRASTSDDELAAAKDEAGCLGVANPHDASREAPWIIFGIARFEGYFLEVKLDTEADRGHDVLDHGNNAGWMNDAVCRVELDAAARDERVHRSQRLFLFLLENNKRLSLGLSGFVRAEADCLFSRGVEFGGSPIIFSCGDFFNFSSLWYVSLQILRAPCSAPI